MRKIIRVLLMLGLFLLILLMVGDRAQAQCGKCDRPDFTIITYPPFVMEDEEIGVRSELRYKTSDGYPDFGREPILSFEDKYFIGPSLRPDQSSRRVPLGVVWERRCLEICGDIGVIVTWTIVPMATVTRASSTTVIDVGPDTVLVLSTKTADLMARLRLKTRDGRFLSEESIIPQFGQKQMVNVGEKFAIGDWVYKLDVLTPESAPTQLLIRVQRQRIALDAK